MYNKWSYVACRPACSCCPEIETYKTVDGETRLMISDDFNSSISISIDEMRLLSENFLKAYEEGKFCESD